MSTNTSALHRVAEDIAFSNMGAVHYIGVVIGGSEFGPQVVQPRPKRELPDGRTVHLILVPPTLELDEPFDQPKGWIVTPAELILGLGYPKSESGHQLVSSLDQQVGGPYALAGRYQNTVRSFINQIITDAGILHSGGLVTDPYQMWCFLEQPTSSDISKVFLYKLRCLLIYAMYMLGSGRYPADTPQEDIVNLAAEYLCATAIAPHATKH